MTPFTVLAHVNSEWHCMYRDTPTIVIVGDQSSGKSSVLESLAKIRLPRGQFIATRVPLVLRFQNTRGFKDDLITISFKITFVKIEEEDEIESEIEATTFDLAGTGTDVVIDSPIWLTIRKGDLPFLTIIDLPAMPTSVLGEAVDISELITAQIQKYLEPPDTIILNVVSATLDFSNYQFTRMSRKVDKKGEKTLTVITKLDKAPDKGYKMVTADDLNTGLGYICVRNRADDESHEKAHKHERALFENHPSLSPLDKRSLGIKSLADRMIEIQANMIRKIIPPNQNVVICKQDEDSNTNDTVQRFQPSTSQSRVV